MQEPNPSPEILALAIADLARVRGCGTLAAELLTHWLDEAAKTAPTRKVAGESVVALLPPLTLSWMFADMLDCAPGHQTALLDQVIFYLYEIPRERYLPETTIVRLIENSI